LLEAAVGAAVATHRLQAINLAGAASHQLQQDITGAQAIQTVAQRLNSAVARPQ
jgi:hypothetical protein